MGTEEDRTTAFPPHKIIGNIYYVGPEPWLFPHCDFAGKYLMDSTYERNVPVFAKSVRQSVQISDTKILLGNHAHGEIRKAMPWSNR
jgi:hypothetical protein